MLHLQFADINAFFNVAENILLIGQLGSAWKLFTLLIGRCCMGVLTPPFTHGLNVERQPLRADPLVEMEFFYVLVSAVLVCADIPDHGIHWTYSGMFGAFWILYDFLFHVFCFPHRNSYSDLTGRFWCVKRAPQPIRVHFSTVYDKTAKEEKIKTLSQLLHFT